MTTRDLQAVDHDEFTVALFRLGQLSEALTLHVHDFRHAFRPFTQDPGDGCPVGSDGDAQRELLALGHEFTALAEHPFEITPREPHELAALFDRQPRVTHTHG